VLNERATEVHVIVIELDDAMATVELLDDEPDELFGPARWEVPRAILPADLEIGSTLVFDRPDATATVLGHHRPPPSVEDRLGRALNRRRLMLDT
jgi:hypothetical protein